MARRTFFSFHYKPDNWRASQVRNMGVIEGNKPVTDNDWEAVTGGGDAAIKRWISDQMDDRTCTVVLVGEKTANRKWINYEIVEAWKRKMGVFGVRIHNLQDSSGSQARMGDNPFDYLSFDDGSKLSSVVKLYTPPQSVSTDVYAYIKNNIAAWTEEAIRIRG